MIDTYHLQELDTRGTHDPLTEDFETLEFTAEDDAKLVRAARPNLITRALAGDQGAMEELEGLHLTKWSVRR